MPDPDCAHIQLVRRPSQFGRSADSNSDSISTQRSSKSDSMRAQLRLRLSSDQIQYRPSSDSAKIQFGFTSASTQSQLRPNPDSKQSEVRFNSDSIQIQFSPNPDAVQILYRFSHNSVQIQFRFKSAASQIQVSHRADFCVASDPTQIQFSSYPQPVRPQLRPNLEAT